MAFILIVSSEVLTKLRKTAIMLLLRFKMINVTFLSVNVSQMPNMSKTFSLQIGFFVFIRSQVFITYFEIKNCCSLILGVKNLQNHMM